MEIYLLCSNLLCWIFIGMLLTRKPVLNDNKKDKVLYSRLKDITSHFDKLYKQNQEFEIKVADDMGKLLKAAPPCCLNARCPKYNEDIAGNCPDKKMAGCKQYDPLILNSFFAPRLLWNPRIFEHKTRPWSFWDGY